MSYRLTKEELDAQYEQFLKESVSDDSLDFKSPGKPPLTKPSHRSAPKATVSWWQDDEDHTGRTEEAETNKCRFLKAKKSQPEEMEDASEAPLDKPVPKPRHKASDEPRCPHPTPRDASPDVSPKAGSPSAPSDHSDSGRSPDESHGAPPADSDSYPLGSSHDGNATFQKPASLVPRQHSSPSLPSLPVGPGVNNRVELSGSGKSFRKSLRRSQSIQEEDEDLGDAGLTYDSLDTAFLTRGSAETDDSASVPAGNVAGMGLDTLEEAEEKARFFSQLEAGASSTIDYSKLNRELDSTGSTVAANLSRRAEEAVDQSDDDDDNQSKAKVTGSGRRSPGSPHYSEDFEDEEIVREPQEEKAKMSPILAKVSLHDSLDDAGEEERRKDTAGSLDKGQSHVQSGGSEMEALQEAYRQIQVVGASDERIHRDSSLEDRETTHRAVSPSSPPHRTQLSLQPVSTNESDLPTAEELMRPIRPEDDQVRGFTLQPISTVDLEHKSTPHALGRTFTEVAPSTHPPGETPGRMSSRPDAARLDLMWSIREEVDRLMQDQNKPSHSSFHGKTKKQPASRGSAVTHSYTTSGVKPSVAPVRGRTVEKRTSRAVAPPRSQSFISSRMQQQQQQPQRAKSSRDKEDSAEAGLRASSELVASVQSLVSVLQQQIEAGGGHQDAVRSLSPAGSSLTRPLPPSTRDESGSVVEELQAQLALKDRELQRMKGGAEELNSLRQQNYLLQTKLRSAEAAGQKQRLKAEDAATEEKLQQMERDIREQETLIKGYQQENEKLYLQMKNQQAKTKANEDAMFNENQRLLGELVLTREQLKKTSRPAGNMCRMDHTQRITDLLAQIHTLERNEVQLSDDVHNLTVERRALEVELQLVKKERDLARTQAASSSGDRSLEVQALEERHREEVASLQKQLRWFAENQELLDRDAGRLKAATAEIQQLKEQVEKLKHEVGRRSAEQPRKGGARSADTRNMQELQQQVKELEHILRSRNPNSLPALIYAAASATGGEEAGADGTSPSGGGITALLERRIQRLEAELESHDDEAKRSLRAMEQQFHRVKLRYEQELVELQQKLEEQQVEVTAAGLEPPSVAAAAEKELQRVKRSHRETEKALHEQIASLQQQLKQKAPPSPNRRQRQAEAAFSARFERLNQELLAKTRSIQGLHRTVERLQRERRSMLSGSGLRVEARPAESRQPASPRKAPGPPAAGADAFPATQYEKTYQPTVFTGSHISEVLQENEALERRMELQQLQAEQEAEARRAEAKLAQEELRRMKEQFAEQVASMKAEHLRATHALEHSSLKVADLANKLSTQEVVLKHLQQQLEGAQGVRDALAVSRTREEALQTQVTRLLQELKEATDARSPEVKLLCSVERKILSMEVRHQHREKELQQVIGGAWQMAGVSQQSELERWKRLAQDKSREVEAFRVELDSILDILRHLQRQGTMLLPS